MYRTEDKNQMRIAFTMPFYGELDPDNRWVVLANEIPWDAYEMKYAEQFSEDAGAPAKAFRMALGALIIQKKFRLTDRETVDMIRENPYLQYFIGLASYDRKNPFDPSLMVYFRKRISSDLIIQINNDIFFKPDKPKEETANQGTLILDATCAPQDIRFPQDASLLNEAREKLEAIIDAVYLFLIQVGLADINKPRTYRVNAHKEYLNYTKGRGGSRKKIRRIVKKLLQYAERDIRHIDKLESLLGKYSLEDILSKKQLADLKVIRELTVQQREMIDENKNRVDNRIVSISQPYVRPIVRKKATAETEFGAKIQVAVINGYTCLDKISWDNFNEGIYLEDAVNKYKERFGYYPEAVLADNIYKTKANRIFCKKNGIRFLGNKTYKEPVLKDKKAKKAYVRDLKARQAVEGKIGNGKRKYSLGLIMTKLKNTSETSISLELMMLNIDKLLKQKLA